MSFGRAVFGGSDSLKYDYLETPFKLSNRDIIIFLQICDLSYNLPEQPLTRKPLL